MTQILDGVEYNASDGTIIGAGHQPNVPEPSTGILVGLGLLGLGVVGRGRPLWRRVRSNGLCRRVDAMGA
ncbi:MAG TPA: PEP-CTERM sorting domain-containing protein [Myxococcales bacterium]|nr:PEP-CTERM sorting domain-containing protein [Myxococcales bacterium]HIL79836.1 PEP-CTERM sorting domain-containing protein [Myxococcales bacterium]